MCSAGLAAEWENIGARVFQSIPDYTEHREKLFNGVGSLVVVPTTGELYVTLNRAYGMWHSRDQGATWTRVAEARVQGRHYGSFSANLDPQTGRFALFSIVSTVDPQSALTSDAGRTWRAINRPSGAKHDGWTWGSIDWSQTEPQVILGKQHHDYTAMWLSRDAGATWEKLPFASRNPGVIDAKTFVATRGTEGDGIHRSTDAGQNWTRVAEFKVNGKTPVRWDTNFYWTAEPGVIVSRDAGATWSLLGQALPDALWGPFFGRDEDSMLVVSRDGFFRTVNRGTTWTKVADFFAGHIGTYDVMHPTVSYGWDAPRGLIYCAPVGGSVWRLKVPAVSAVKNVSSSRVDSAQSDVAALGIHHRRP